MREVCDTLVCDATEGVEDTECHVVHRSSATLTSQALMEDTVTKAQRYIVILILAVRVPRSEPRRDSTLVENGIVIEDRGEVCVAVACRWIDQVQAWLDFGGQYVCEAAQLCKQSVSTPARGQGSTGRLSSAGSRYGLASKLSRAGLVVMKVHDW